MCTSLEVVADEDLDFLIPEPSEKPRTSSEDSHPPKEVLKAKAAPTSVKHHASNGVLRVYTDGACSKNGRSGARAGWGYHCPGNEMPDASGALSGALQTNQRAELTAVAEALESVKHLPVDQRPSSIRVYSDSQYTIKCHTSWLHNWKRNGWKNANGKAVSNIDLIQQIDRSIQALRSNLNIPVTFQHVDGHSNNPGNDRADALARIGARSHITKHTNRKSHVI